MNIIERLNARIDAVNSLLCVGLDSDYERLPKTLHQFLNPQFAFNQSIIEETHEIVCAYKPNIAFYEARGERGIEDLRRTMGYLREKHPDILTICDAKRADIGNTSRAYAQAIFDNLNFDIVTLNPYLGRDALQPFLEREDKGCIILCRTSNTGSGEFQDLLIDGKPLWQVVAETVASDWNINNNCLLVVGATYPDEMKIIRDVAGDMTLLVPGIGTQGGDIEQTVKAGLNSEGKGLILNSSRGIIFSDNPAEMARTLRDTINIYRL